MSFSINCIEIPILDEKILKTSSHLYKNIYTEKDLKSSKRFFLNDYYEYQEIGTGELKKNSKSLNLDLFFAKNINIQVIVGKNGSGKSTLMDLMYSAINNFAYMFERGKRRPGAEKLYFIPNLYVNLYFSISNSKDHDGEYVLICKNETVQLKKDSVPINNLSLDDKEAELSDSDIIELVGSFFYTIVTNYSMQSFIYSNYSGKTKEYDLNSKKTIDSTKRCYWINSIFHKNDGYITPIVLNPYRYDGYINCENELELSKDRLASLFIYSEQKKEKLFAPYSFCKMIFRLRENCLIEKYNSIYSKLNKNSEYEEVEKDCDVLYLLNDKIISTLEKQFDFSYSKSKLEKIAVCYLILKIIDITLKYPNYIEYKGVIYFDKEQLSIKNDELFYKLLDKIKQDNTHITKKIERVVHFLRLDNSKFNNKDEFSWEYYTSEIANFYKQSRSTKAHKNSFNKYPFRNAKTKSFKSLLDINNHMPPSIFDYELTLNKEQQEQVNYSDLSSGELQLLQTLSTHAYHIENILSINGEDRPKYRCLNLVFDEIEMCFHPEYQRQFVQRLINMLTIITNNDEAFFNIIIITHSPFVLSDIPEEKILFMKNGKQDKKFQKTFAGNISEMMYESFFLTSTIGEFAENKIKKLIKDKKDENNIKELIGDIVIKSLLKETLNESSKDKKND